MARSKKKANKPAADMPIDFKNHIATMGGSSVQLVTQKKLHPKDLDKDHGRFSIPNYQIRSRFLTTAEENVLDTDRKVLDVLMVDPSLHVCCVSLIKKPNLTNSKVFFYSFTTNWTVILKKNVDVLKKDAVVQLWSFRCNSELCFALINVRDGEGDGTDSNDSSSSNANWDCTSRKRKEPEASYSSQPLRLVPVMATTVANLSEPVSPTLLLAGYMAYEYLMMKGTLGGQKLDSTLSEAMPFQDDSVPIEGQEGNNQDGYFVGGDKSETA